MLALLCSQFVVSITLRVVVVGRQPIQPYGSWSTPCQNVSASGCKGGFPAIAALLRESRHGVDGTVHIGNFAQLDRVIQLHPAGLDLNQRLWGRAKAGFFVAVEPYFLKFSQRHAVAGQLGHSFQPFLCSNLHMSDGMEVFRGMVQYSIITEPIRGFRIGFIMAYPSSFWIPTLGYGTLVKDLVLLLQRTGADKVVVLTLVYSPPEEVVLLKQSGADVILLPTTQGQPEHIERPDDSGPLVVYTAGLPGKLHTFDLIFSNQSNVFTLKDATVGSYDTENIPDRLRDTQFRADEAFMQSEVDRAYRSQRIFGYSLGDMPSGYVKHSDGSRTSPCREGECELGQLFTKSMSTFRDSQIEIVNGGGLRDGWAAGNITRIAISGAFPFQNHLCYLNMTAAELYRALEHGVSTVTSEGKYNRSEKLNGQFLQVRGLRYTFNPRLKPYHRITNMETPGSDGTWQEISFDVPYRVATLSYLCENGDGYNFQSHGEVGKEHAQTEAWSVLSQHIEDVTYITPKVDGTILMDMEGEVMEFVKMHENCTVAEFFRAEWEICEACPMGMYNPQHGKQCIPLPEMGEGDGGSSVVSVVLPVVIGVAFAFAAVFSVHAAVHRRKMYRKLKNAPQEGNMAFVFTDILRSSELWEAFPSGMEQALATHHAMCRGLIERYEGYEVKTIGDAFMVAFADHVNAVAFLCELQMDLVRCDWPSEILGHPACRMEPGFKGLRVRCGMHIGPAVVTRSITGYDYEGPTVNLCSRVSDAGSGGQIIVTESAYHSVEEYFHRISTFVDVKYLGTFRVKGVQEDVPLYQLMPEALSVRMFGALRHVVVVDTDNQDETSQTAQDDTFDKAKYIDAVQILRKWCHTSGGVPVNSFVGLLHQSISEGMVREVQVTGALLQILICTSRDYREDVSSLSETTDASTTVSGLVFHRTLSWVLMDKILKSLPGSSVIFMAEMVGRPLEAASWQNPLKRVSTK